MSHQNILLRPRPPVQPFAEPQPSLGMYDFNGLWIDLSPVGKMLVLRDPSLRLDHPGLDIPQQAFHQNPQLKKKKDKGKGKMRAE